MEQRQLQSCLGVWCVIVLLQRLQGSLGCQTARAARALPAVPLRALLLLGCACTRATASTYWALSDTYVGPDFFTKWNFFTQADPTHGAVEYIDYPTALTEGLVSADANRVYMGADKAAGALGSGRHSVRIESVAVFNGGLFVVTLDHIPTGCGTWPAFWMFGEGALHAWPAWGEYDILEGVHTGSRANTALHTTSGCDQSSIQANWNQGSSKPADNCDVDAPGQLPNQGCSQRGPPNSFGPGFNGQGGGTYVAEWDPVVGKQIRTWFWPVGTEPVDLLRKRPEPELWGAPFSHFTLDSTMCPASHFQNMRLVFDITFCGDLGEATYKEFCPAEAARTTCRDLVMSGPLPEAYWSIRAMDVYELKARREVEAPAPAPVPIAWTRILCAAVAIACTVGAAWLIVRHTRQRAESGAPGRGSPPPAQLYHLHRGGHLASPQEPTKVKLVRQVPCKWRQVTSTPPGAAPGDEPLDLAWETEMKPPEVVPPAPGWPPEFVATAPSRESTQEELDAFALDVSSKRPQRSPWACGCCRQQR
mmetsp:Transcript_88560/g.274215  ORF Transcript_88560/g.274215 Transcript_88560/m.274215 type:complete len:534 (-) Transcript_88560:216-1817(-)